jgi:hypothetical protein
LAADEGRGVVGRAVRGVVDDRRYSQVKPFWILDFGLAL